MKDNKPCREAFEKWCIQTRRSIRPSIVLGSYEDMYVCMAWQAWQAAYEFGQIPYDTLLLEARAELIAYVENEWPECARERYPSYQQKYERDMDLPNRIGQALAALESRTPPISYDAAVEKACEAFSEAAKRKGVVSMGDQMKAALTAMGISEGE